MGQAKERQLSQEKFLALPENARCIYCGECAGVAMTVDHFPPRCFFERRAWPETYMFPACLACNKAMRTDEQVLATLLRIPLDNDKVTEEWHALAKGVVNNNRKYMEEWISTSAVANKIGMRERFGKQGDAMRFQSYRLATLGPKTQALLDRFCIKLAQALYFRHTGKILGGEVFWFTMPIQVLQIPKVHELFLNMDQVPSLSRSGKDLSKQFFYRYFSHSDGNAVFLVVQFGQSQFLFQISALDQSVIDHPTFKHEVGKRSGYVGPPLSTRTADVAASEGDRRVGCSKRSLWCILQGFGRQPHGGMIQWCRMHLLH